MIIVLRKQIGGLMYVSSRTRSWLEKVKAEDCIFPSGLLFHEEDSRWSKSWLVFKPADLQRVIAILRLNGLSVEVEGCGGMVTLRKFSSGEWCVSYGYSSFQDYSAACEALHRAGVASTAEHTFPAKNLQSAVAVLRLAGFDVELFEK